MSIITLTFTCDINISAQVGDTAYNVENITDSSSEHHTTYETSVYTFSPGFDQFALDVAPNKIKEIGKIIEISKHTSGEYTGYPFIKVETIYDGLVPPGEDSNFIMFSKDNAVNMSSPLGYFATVKFKNNSTVKSEIFSVGCEMFESSK
jgi:hypothetical protein